MPGRRSAVAERLAFACERLQELARGLPDERAKRWKALASRLAAAVPELRAHGVPFGVLSWLAGSSDEQALAEWCCRWFREAASMQALTSEMPNSTVDCVKWLLEREAAELRFFQRETEALVEQLKNLAKGYALAEEKATKVVA